jgi:O-antigen/teichoic acid export membrane protein
MAVNQIKAGVVLSYCVLGLNTVVGLAYTPYMLRMMGQSEYGLYSLVASVIAYLTILDLGFGNAVVRYTAKYRAEGKTQEQYTLFGMLMRIYIVISLLSIIAGWVLYNNTDALFSRTMTAEELSKAGTMIAILVFNLAVTFPFSLFGSIITAYEDFVFAKLIQIVRIILSTVTMIVLLHEGYRAIGMVVVTTVFNVLSLLVNLIYARYKIGARIKFGRIDWSLFREISTFSFWVFLNAIMDRIYWGTGQFILGAVSGTVAVAVYSVAITIKEMYFSFSTAVSNVFLPRVTGMVAKKAGDREISDLFIRTGRIQYIVLAFILTGFIIFGRQFIILWAGPDYEGSYTITLLFFIPTTVPLVQNLAISILQARNRMKFRSLVLIVISLLSIVSSVCLGKAYGAMGVAWSLAAVVTLGHIIILNIYYNRKHGIDIIAFWREISRMSLCPLVVGAVAWLVVGYFQLDTVPKLAFGVIVFAMVYLPLFWFTSMNGYEKELILAPCRKVINKFARRRSC